jgi:hypothetical protein
MSLHLPPLRRRHHPGEWANSTLFCSTAPKSLLQVSPIDHPGMMWNWWTREVSDHALMSPPQHGKCFLATDFIAWLGGLQPDWQTIYASYSEELAKRANKALGARPITAFNKRRTHAQPARTGDRQRRCRPGRQDHPERPRH